MTRHDAPADAIPQGTLALRTLSMPADLNGAGTIFGGWLMGCLDQAAGLAAATRSGGNVATVAVKELLFLHPLHAHQDVRIYADLLKTGRTSMHFRLEVWAGDLGATPQVLAAHATFVMVALDAEGRPRPLAITA
ncbi:acyl-CoA thioesterase [Komagataeibacter xylinus]|uniref:Acyl-CoA thioesterase n=1 Tax=Komagataeibacter xylinus TaxID=28448 RepID=A0A318PMD9_KOMXY|nr:acyl-CoA thioesterase [Komagataeibacter xylinus]AZV39829.1 acyl-CoA thioesterase [Komagataeibacter xylinus]PYD56750.1 acyl-CoA thioesterase [Komagataeibacter xylinus]GBQ74103.1 acyl-CoA hydrolase [Komagataeibacter xylinus NBRC 15237]